MTLSARMARPTIPIWRDAMAQSPSLKKLAEDFLRYLTAVRGYSPETERRYGRAIDQFRGYLQAAGVPDTVASFTDSHLLGFMTYLAGRAVKPNTIVIALSALSSFARYLCKVKDERGKSRLSSNPTKAIDWPQVEASDTAYLYSAEFRAWLEVALPTHEAAARDLLADTGLRAGELCRVTVGDLLPSGVLAVTVKGRGTRRRRLHLPVSAEAMQSLRASLDRRTELLTREIPGVKPEMPPDAPLLVTERGARYTRSSLYYLVRRIAADAGVTRCSVGPHTIRHTVNVVRKLGGVDAYTRSRLLGQSSPRSQERYDHIVPGALAEAKALQAEGLRAYLGT